MPVPARADVAIVGAGYTGLSAALTLARAVTLYHVIVEGTLAQQGIAALAVLAMLAGACGGDAEGAAPEGAAPPSVDTVATDGGFWREAIAATP